MLKKIFITVSLLGMFQMINAQKELKINDIFDTYGKRQGSILIELAKDVLGNRTNISKYKSLILTLDSEAVDDCMQAIQNDVAEGSVILEKKQGGRIETASYCLRKGDSPEYEYILFNVKAKNMTLIYIRGKFPPKDLEKEIGVLSNLFIKVNDKHIKFKRIKL